MKGVLLFQADEEIGTEDDLSVSRSASLDSRGGCPTDLDLRMARARTERFLRSGARGTVPLETTAQKHSWRDAESVLEIAGEMRGLFVTEIERDFFYALPGDELGAGAFEAQLAKPVRNCAIESGAKVALQRPQGNARDLGQIVGPVARLCRQALP